MSNLKFYRWMEFCSDPSSILTEVQMSRETAIVTLQGAPVLRIDPIEPGSMEAAAGAELQRLGLLDADTPTVSSDEVTALLHPK